MELEIERNALCPSTAREQARLKIKIKNRVTFINGREGTNDQRRNIES
jgi:hypothetical protein